jgi:hypothetical protein
MLELIPRKVQAMVAVRKVSDIFAINTVQSCSLRP